MAKMLFLKNKIENYWWDSKHAIISILFIFIYIRQQLIVNVYYEKYYPKLELLIKLMY